MSRPPVPRREERSSVVLTAQCRTSTGLRGQGMISDLSAKGCCVTTNGLFIRQGARVLIRPEGMEGLTGVVRWINGLRAGIEFDVPLYGPVLEHLCGMHGAGAMIQVDGEGEGRRSA